MDGRTYVPLHRNCMLKAFICQGSDRCTSGVRWSFACTKDCMLTGWGAGGRDSTSTDGRMCGGLRTYGRVLCVRCFKHCIDG